MTKQYIEITANILGRYIDVSISFLIMGLFKNIEFLVNHHFLIF